MKAGNNQPTNIYLLLRVLACISVLLMSACTGASPPQTQPAAVAPTSPPVTATPIPAAATPLPATDTPIPPTVEPTPTAEPTEPPASPTPAITLTMADVVGVWSATRDVVRFTAEGEVFYYDKLEYCYLNDSRYRVQYRIENNNIVFEGGPVSNECEVQRIVPPNVLCLDGSTLTFEVQEISDDEMTVVRHFCNGTEDTRVLRRAVARGVQWVQSTDGAFISPENTAIQSLSLFTDPERLRHAFISTLNPTTGAQLWRRQYIGTMARTAVWSAITRDGFGNPANIGIAHLLQFKGQLYAGTTSDEQNGGEVWRSANGTTWKQVVAAGFGDPTNAEVTGFIEFRNAIYAGTRSLSDQHGAEIWRSATGDAGDWERVVADGFGDAQNQAVSALVVFNKALFAGATNPAGGLQVWRSVNGKDWTAVVPSESGAVVPVGEGVTAFATYNAQLYAATTGGADLPTGVAVWACQACDGSDWSRSTPDGFGTPGMTGAAALMVYQDALYLVASNPASGIEVWRTESGTAWEKVSESGFGNPNNAALYSANAVTSMSNRLLVGTSNQVDGSQLYIYLPSMVDDASVAAKDATVPFKASYAMLPRIVGPDPDNPGCQIQELPGTGRATYLGDSTWYSDAIGCPEKGTQSGSSIFTAENGDQLIGTFSGVSVMGGTPAEPQVEFSGTAWVTEGTGQFVGYTGTLAYSGTVALAASPMTGELTFDGMLTKPEKPQP